MPAVGGSAPLPLSFLFIASPFRSARAAPKTIERSRHRLRFFFFPAAGRIYFPAPRNDQESGKGSRHEGKERRSSTPLHPFLTRLGTPAFAVERDESGKRAGKERYRDAARRINCSDGPPPAVACDRSGQPAPKALALATRPFGGAVLADGSERSRGLSQGRWQKRRSSRITTSLRGRGEPTAAARWLPC